MSAVRLALLIAAHEGAEARRNFRRELDADLVEFDVQEGQLPETFAFDGCVVTGSRSSVYWDDPWLPPLKSWIADAIDHGLPFLGVCYGHQLLADVLGGTVEGMGEYELGYRRVRQVHPAPIFADIDEEFLVFISHQDRVTELPPGATQIAENDYGIHGFQLGEVFGIQFHPEYDMAMAEQVTRGKDISEEQQAAVLAGITDENYAAASQAKLVFDNFVEYVAEHQRPQARAEA